jgi:hypothetical protein
MFAQLTGCFSVDKFLAALVAFETRNENHAGTLLVGHNNDLARRESSPAAMLSRGGHRVVLTLGLYQSGGSGS